jgi:hypothetical protein
MWTWFHLTAFEQHKYLHIYGEYFVRLVFFLLHVDITLTLSNWLNLLSAVVDALTQKGVN